MIKLHSLPKTTQKSKKRVGRGYGSGIGGHTSGRGQKGQRTRSRVQIWFEGGQLPQIRRFPFIRGKGRFKSLNGDALPINLSDLNKLPAKTTVTAKTLIDHKLASQKDLRTRSIKIVGQGKLTKALTVSLPATRQATQKIEAAGGKVISESAD